MENVNPARRYKSFRPRQAARITFLQGAGTNYGTIGLFNNSSGALYLIVRDYIVWDVSAGDPVNVATVQGALATASALPSPLIAQQAALPGFLWALDDANAITADYTFCRGQTQLQWFHDFPFAVLPPGQSLVFQTFVKAEALALSLVYEAIEPDELDFAFQDL